MDERTLRARFTVVMRIEIVLQIANTIVSKARHCFFHECKIGKPEFESITCIKACRTSTWNRCFSAFESLLFNPSHDCNSSRILAPTCHVLHTPLECDRRVFWMIHIITFITSDLDIISNRHAHRPLSISRLRNENDVEVLDPRQRVGPSVQQEHYGAHKLGFGAAFKRGIVFDAPE